MIDNHEVNPIYVVFDATGYADSIDREFHMRPHTHSACERQWQSVPLGSTALSLHWICSAQPRRLPLSHPAFMKDVGTCNRTCSTGSIAHFYRRVSRRLLRFACGASKSSQDETT